MYNVQFTTKNEKRRMKNEEKGSFEEYSLLAAFLNKHQTAGCEIVNFYWKCGF
jgi:hypothetical protein